MQKHMLIINKINLSYFRTSCWKGSLLLLILLGACKKTELPPPVEEDPVFSISATLEGETLDFVAGEKDYYLFTSFVKDEFNVFSFKGRFEKLIDCESNCKETLEFEIRDLEVKLENSVNPDRSLNPGIYSLSSTDNVQVDTILEGYEVAFENTTIANIPLQYSWDLGTAIPVDSFIPDTRFYPTNNLNQVVTLSIFEIGGAGSCFGQRTQAIQFQGAPGPICNLSFTSDSDTVTNRLCAEMNGVAPFTYQWDVEFDSIYPFECLDGFNLNDSLNIVLTGTDELGCTRSRKIFVQESFNTPPFSFCSPDFSYEVQPRFKLVSNSGFDSLSLSKVIIRYTDEDGILYSSENATQAIEDRFEILESSDYLDNENGKKTRLLKVRFSGVLLSEGGTELRLDKGEGTIAVAYPD